jgi:hypothetical protein
MALVYLLAPMWFGPEGKSPKAKLCLLTRRTLWMSNW